MMWPFTARKNIEKRSDYTSTILDAVFQNATAESGNAGQTAALECAAGYVGRSLAAATVEPQSAAELLTPYVLNQAGRTIIRHGAALWIDDGSYLSEGSYWNFLEGATYDRSGWVAQVTDAGPSGTRTRNLPYSRLIFVQWGNNAAVPWTNHGPLQSASLTGKLAANSERSLVHDTNTPASSVIEVSSDTDDSQLAAFKSALNNAAGRLFLADTMRSGDRQTEPDASWAQRRIGPMPDETLAQVASDAFARALAACGIAPDLFTSGANSQGQREAARRTFLNLILPLTRLIEHEVRQKLDPTIRIHHHNLFTDLASRAVTVKKLTEAGVSLDVALAATELDDQ